MLSDLKFALRQLLKNPGFTIRSMTAFEPRIVLGCHSCQQHLAKQNG